MKVDISLKDLFLVTYDEYKVHLNYKDDKLITLVFNSVEEAENFFSGSIFLTENHPMYKGSAVNLTVKSIYVGYIPKVGG